MREQHSAAAAGHGPVQGPQIYKSCYQEIVGSGVHSQIASLYLAGNFLFCVCVCEGAI